MPDWLSWLIVLPVSYLIGAIPSGVLVARLWRNVDIRNYGSGGSGATNVLRTLGKPAAGLVLALDFCKGVVAVLLAKWIGSDSAHVLTALSGVLAIGGHMWPVYAGFQGGKGVATGWGALLALSPISASATLLGLAVAGITRVVSLGAIVGASAGVVLLIALSVAGVEPIEYIAFAVPSIALIVFKHIDNIKRLIEGRERRLESKSLPERRSSGS